MQTSGMILGLQILMWSLIGVILILALAYFMVDKKKTEKREQMIQSKDNDEEVAKTNIQNYGKFQGELTKESIYEFMEFDDIVDNMIVRKKGSQYVMVLQCNGVNYDLMSEIEKISVEEGFVQFLNTLRFPIQLYVQSRTLNLKDIIDSYRGRVENLEV